MTDVRIGHVLASLPALLAGFVGGCSIRRAGHRTDPIWFCSLCKELALVSVSTNLC